MLFLNRRVYASSLLFHARLTVTNVVFESFKGKVLDIENPGLTVTNVVFEYIHCILCRRTVIRLTVTNVVFEFPKPHIRGIKSLGLTVTNVVFE